MKPTTKKGFTFTERKTQRGFTFIEILVVATIIGLLMTIGIASYQIANKKSRDGRRKADLEQIRSALEMYRVDIGVYPAALSSLTTTYIQAIPTPPPKSLTTGGATMTSYQQGFTCADPYRTYTLSLQLEVADEDYYVYNP